MPFEIVRSDIVNMPVDAVVNTAGRDPVIGSGVDAAIHKKAGRELLEARKKIGRIDYGEAAITPGYHLDAGYVIHTVAAVWQGGNCGEEKLLSSCYRRSLTLAKENGCESVAFPWIAAGNCGFPKPLALQIAVREISAFLMENEMQIFLVVFDSEAFALSEKLFASVNGYIDANYICSEPVGEYCADGIAPMPGRRDRRKESPRKPADVEILLCEDVYDSAPQEDPTVDFIGCMECIEVCDDWNEILKDLDAGFSETLLQLIDRTGKKDSEIYKKANVDRKLFSKIRNNLDYKPSKATALAFAFALELDIEETKDFIGRAGFALSHSSKFDVIVEYFLVNKIYDVFELNEVLFAFDQPLIGA